MHFRAVDHVLKVFLDQFTCNSVALKAFLRAKRVR